MSVRLDAEGLLEQLNQAENVLWRMMQNRAYGAHQKGEVQAFYEKVRQQRNVISPVVERIENLELLDPLHTSRPNDWMDIGILVADHLSRFAREVREPLADRLQNVEGPAAASRWAARKGAPLPPVLQVRERWAVLVGISDYGQTGFTSLSTPKADAEAVHALLLGDRRHGYQPERTRMFIDGKAQRDDILEAVKVFARSAGGEDMILFYFSGHGDLADGDAILIPHNLDPVHPQDSALPIAQVMELMAASPARAKIVILDACHSGPDIPVDGEERKGVVDVMGMDPEFERRVFESARGTAVLSACVARQVSWTYRKVGLSAFTYFLRDGLRGAADVDDKGFVTVSDAFHYAVNGVRGWGDERGLVQTPALSYTTTGEIVLMDYRQGRNG
jgi:Caspase domain